jgi:hypothetical protein
MTEEYMSLEELGVDEDPGTEWHPREDKAEARDSEGNLYDLDDNDVAEHERKPEAAEQIDAGQVLSAEDSAESPEGEV